MPPNQPVQPARWAPVPSLFSRFGSILPILVGLLLLWTVTPILAQTAGSVDPLDAGIVGGFGVYGSAVQPDGKVILVGSFTEVGGQSRNRVARLNADGTLDMAFNPNADNEVYAVAVQADGKVLLGGGFTQMGGQSRNGIARVNVDGTLDTGFNPGANSLVSSVVVQADGKVLLGGFFTRVGGQPRNYIARVNADGTLDAGFNPDANSIVLSVSAQADGKVLLGGVFTQVSGQTRNRIARLNADGTLDTGFNPNADLTVYVVTVQADGKVLLGGFFSQVGGQRRSSIARVNNDGTLDSGFNPGANGEVLSVSVQADGKVLLGGGFTKVDGEARNRIARLNPDGTVDLGFDPNANDWVDSVAVQGDGKVLLGGGFTQLQPNGAITPTVRPRFARLNNDGAIESLSVPDSTRVVWQRGGSSPELAAVTFELSTDGGAHWEFLGAGLRAGTTPDWQWSGNGLPVSGQVRARGRTSGGYFGGSSGLVESVAAFAFEVDLAVEQPENTALADGTGSVDFGVVNLGSLGLARTFTIRNLGTYPLSGLNVITDGPDKGDFVVSGLADTTVAPGGTTTFAVTFIPGAQGSRAATVRVASNATGPKNPYTVAVTGTGVLATDPGSVDPLAMAVEGGVVNGTAVQPDGKVILVGRFTQVAGQPRNRIARLNADGTLDMGFDPNANDEVYGVVVQADGKVVLGGVFTELGGQPRNRIARVNADGTLDTGFNPGANNLVLNVAVQADGKVLMGGFFTRVGGQGRSRIARIHTDGTVDVGFSPSANSAVFNLVQQGDGKVLVGGSFTQVNGQTRNRIARLNTDGTLDVDFNPNANASVFSLATQADGKVLLGGSFTQLGGQLRSLIARVNADGTLDSGFNPGVNSDVHSLAVQADGKVLLGGLFTSAGGQPRNYVARLNPDGTLDEGFHPNANNWVESLALQTDGKVLLGGSFTQVQPNGASTPTQRAGFARLNNDGATQNLGVPDPTRVVWQRGGSSPELAAVTFERSTDGGAVWEFLGDGVRVGTTPDWQWSGVGLPVSGHVRARGRTTGGAFGSSSGLVESVATYALVVDLAVEQPGNTVLADGVGSLDFGTVDLGSLGAARTFTIRNVGTLPLSDLEVIPEGPDATDFMVGPVVDTTVAPGGTTTFAVIFNPGSQGPRTATVKILSNVTGPKNPYTVTLTGIGGNAPPIAGADTIVRPGNARVVKVAMTELLGNDSDPDADLLSVTGVGNPLPAGALVSIVGNFVVYTAPTTTAGEGSFEYTLRDGPGGHAVTGRVTVTENATPGSGNPNASTIAVSGPDIVVSFLGVPGRAYRVQYTTSTMPPYAWQEFSPPTDPEHVARPNGVFIHTDVAPVDPFRLYRAIPKP